MYKKRGFIIRLVAGIVLAATLLSGCTGAGNGRRGNSGSGESTESSGGRSNTENQKKRDRYGELEAIHYSPGYGDMVGEYHSETVRRDENGDVVYVIKDRESFNESAVTRTYAMPEDALTRLEDIIREYDLTDLENRRMSERLVTDYSPWSYQFVFEKDNVRLTEFRRYKKKDLEHLKELMDTAHAMRGELISTEREGDDTVSAPDTEQILKAYADILRETAGMEDLSEEASFAMGYIDDDGIPELLVAENSGQADGIHVYAFKDGSVIDCGYFGHYGGFMRYLPREGLISTYYMWMGVEAESYATLKNGEVEWTRSIARREVYHPENDSYDYTYTIDKEEVTLEAYERALDAYADRQDDYVFPEISRMMPLGEAADYQEALRPFLEEDYLYRLLAGDDEAGGTQDEEDIAEQNFRYSHGGYSREEFIAYVYGTMWAKNGDENSAIVDLWEDGTFIAVEGMGGVVEATGTYEFRADLYGPHRPFLFTMYREDGSVFTEFELVYSHNLEGEIVLFFGDNIYRRIY